MKVEKVRQIEETPFVTITFTKKEAWILKRLVQFNINEYKGDCGTSIFSVHENPNLDFSYPLYKELNNLGV